MQSNWQLDFFRGIALDAWRRCFNPDSTGVEVEFLARILQAGADRHFLDVPCGNGRHAIGLAGLGCRMTGVDLAEEFIAEARRASSAVRWVLGDMRELPWTAEFDGAYCLGNSFGYFDAGAARVFLAAVARVLKPGARFIIDTGMAAESILPTRVPKRWYQLDDLFMLSENRYDPRHSRLDIDYTFIRNGEVDRRPTASYVFTVAELCRMQAEAGLQVTESLASWSGEPYEFGSQRLILVSEKR